MTHASTIIVRHATATDAALLADIGAQTFLDAFGAVNTPENMDAYLASSFNAAKQATELADPAVVFLIAELDGPVGYAQLRAGAAPAVVMGARPMELVRLYAVKSRIGQGVGQRLMRSCLHEARTRSHDVIWLGVWEHNQRARAFYRRWGFADVGTHIFQLGNDPQTDVLMQRRLSPDVEEPARDAIIAGEDVTTSGPV